MLEDHYKTLSARPSASQSEIREAYRDAVRRCHPDLHPDDQRARTRFQQVQAAFDVLDDPEKRKVYNRSRISLYTTWSSTLEPSVSRGGEHSYRSLAHYAGIQVSEPVTGLIVTTALGISIQCFALFGYLVQGGGGAAGSGGVEMPVMLGGGPSVLVSVLGCILASVVILGAVQMSNLENYRLAVTGAIVATFCCISPWFFLGLPFGIWALVVLCDPRVRDAFWS